MNYDQNTSTAPVAAPEAGEDREIVRGQPAQAAKQKVSEWKDQLATSARDTSERLRSQGQDALARQKERAADELNRFAAAIHGAADRLFQDGDETIGEYAEALGRRAEGVADYLRGRDVRELVNDAEDLARSRPELFLAGMFVAGLGLARFLKASKTPRSQAERFEPEESETYAGGTVE